MMHATPKNKEHDEIIKKKEFLLITLLLVMCDGKLIKHRKVYLIFLTITNPRIDFNLTSKKLVKKERTAIIRYP